VISVIKSSIEFWPTLVEISYLENGWRGLPQVRVRNQRGKTMAPLRHVPLGEGNVDVSIARRRGTIEASAHSRTQTIDIVVT
jgi:hypothetical protein